MDSVVGVVKGLVVVVEPWLGLPDWRTFECVGNMFLKGGEDAAGGAGAIGDTVPLGESKGEDILLASSWDSRCRRVLHETLG